jgi:hypothetical protein
LIFSAYLLVSAHAEQFQQHQTNQRENPTAVNPQLARFEQHPDWETGTTWKSALNNLRLLLQPYWCWAWIDDWLQAFAIPGLSVPLHQLMEAMDLFEFFRFPTG